MQVFFKIALRNLIKNRRRTLLIGITLVISCTLLLFSFTIGNGLQRQIMKKYRDFQSGDVTVVWSNVKEVDISDPSRLFFSKFDIKRKGENDKAIQSLNSFLQEHSHEILAHYSSIHGSGMLDTGHYASPSIIMGITGDDMRYLQKNNVFKLAAGDVPMKYKYGICISEDVAFKNNISIGDWVVLDCTTVSGYVNSLEYRVVGFYKSSSDFDSIYVYMSRDNALELLDQEPEYFQSVRIYLKNPEDAEQFAAKLDAFLTEKANVLRAEPMSYSAQFYSTIAGFLKMLFLLFVVFILFIIAIGIRSAVRINLFERMKEFGTLRAIGFSRSKSFFIVFLEMFLLSMISFAAAYILTLILVLILGSTGIYIGKGAIAYAVGGEFIYPVFVLSDTVTALLIITLFSLFAPLKPGLRLCFQEITSLLAQNQKQVSVILSILKKYLKWK